MDVDRKTIIGILLIGLIIIFTNTDFYRNLVVPQGQEPATRRIEPPTETTPPELPSRTAEPEIEQQAPPPGQTTPDARRALRQNILADFALSLPQHERRNITVETPLYTAVLSNKGPSIASWTLKKYFGPDSLPLQLIRQGESNFFLSFPVQKDTLSFAGVTFDVEADRSSYFLDATNPQQTISFVIDLGDGRILRQALTFFHNKYAFDLNIGIEGFEQFVDGYTYSINLTGGLNSTEKDISEDMSYASAIAAAGNEDVEFDAKDEKMEVSDWRIDWVAARTKYFTQTMLMTHRNGTGVKFLGDIEKLPDGKELKSYSMEMRMSYQRSTVNDSFKVYIGPLQYDILKSYNAGLEEMLPLGPAYIIRPLSKLVLWTITKMYTVIPNYGVVIILFSILVKIVLHPLTKKSYQSMKDMQKLQPMLKELREKYPNDPQKMNAEMMQIYREHGVNPFGGCLPMLLQMPLLFALFQVFRTTIEFRGAPFVSWINDLSAPDTLIQLPFSIPIYGDGINVLPLVMGLTMFLQQKATITDPKQKVMVYMMPALFTFIFNNFPSGLTLYYTLFNVLTIIHQKLIPESKEPVKQKAQQSKKKVVPKKKMSRLEMMRQLRRNR